MTPGVLNLNYLSFYLAKIQNKGQFWNPQNKQISKLTLLFKFCEDLMEILPKTKLGNFQDHPLYYNTLLWDVTNIWKTDYNMSEGY